MEYRSGRTTPLRRRARSPRETTRRTRSWRCRASFGCSRLRFALSFGGIERHGGDEKPPQAVHVHRVALEELDRAPLLAAEFGVEDAVPVVELCTVDEGHLHHALERIADAQD